MKLQRFIAARTFSAGLHNISRNEKIVFQGSKQWIAGSQTKPFKNSKSLSPILKNNEIIDVIQSFPKKTVAALLPRDFPLTVRDGYGRYVTGQMIGAVSSSAAGVLSMQALLHAVGLGSGAIPMAAALNWVIKDGLGQFGGVLFAANVNTKFDSDPKRWRLVSCVALDLSCFLELLTPVAPALFIPLAATANVGKNISWLAASASRAAIHNSFARSSNLADITAKSGAQSICASLVGTSLGIGVSSVIGNEWGLPLILSFAALSSSHIVAIAWSLSSVTLHTLNPQRGALLVDALMSSGTVSSPTEVSQSESFLPVWMSRPVMNDWLQYGVPLTYAVESPTELSTLLQHSPYLLSVKTRATGGVEAEAAIILILLEDTTPPEFLQGLIHAHLIKQHLTEFSHTVFATPGTELRTQAGWTMRFDLIHRYRQSAELQSAEFSDKLREKGWVLDVFHNESGALSFNPPNH